MVYRENVPRIGVRQEVVCMLIYAVEVRARLLRRVLTGMDSVPDVSLTKASREDF
jgi:hypothetical protein